MYRRSAPHPGPLPGVPGRGRSAYATRAHCETTLKKAIAKRLDNIPKWLPEGLQKDLSKLRDKVNDAIKRIDSKLNPKPKGSANAETAKWSGNGSSAHADKPGMLPDQLRAKYPETPMEFRKPGVPGQDVKVLPGGKHPSEYPGSKWEKGRDHGDFKPDTDGGRKTFKSDQKNKWKEPTQMLPYERKTKTLKCP